MTHARTPRHPSTDSDLDDTSLDAIRSILTDEADDQRAEAKSRRKAEGLRPLIAANSDPVADTAQNAPAPKKSTSPKFAALRAKIKIPRPKRTAALGPKQQDGLQQDGMMARVRAYRPTTTHMVLGALAALVLILPWLVIGIVFFSIFITVGLFLIIGHDSFWQGVMKGGRWYATRRPQRAAVLHARLDAFAVRWDGVLDKFPEGSVDALYLPDFGQLATAERRHEEALDRRLSSLQETSV